MGKFGFRLALLGYEKLVFRFGKGLLIGLRLAKGL